MDPRNISDLYQRYKIGTKRIVQWLADTARKRCKRSSLSLPGSNASKRNSGNTKLSTSDIARLSQQIAAEADPKRAPPEDVASIIIILEDVIAGRREYSVWHAQRGAHSRDTSGEQDVSHVHFVDVLKSILGDMKFALSNSSASKKQKKPAYAVPLQHTPAKRTDKAVFESIQAVSSDREMPTLEEPATEAERPPVSPQVSATANRYELENQGEDAAFAFWCFLKDCYNIRLFVRDLWTSYCKGNLSLLVAATVTDRAFTVIYYAAQELINDFPDLATFDAIAELMEIQVCTSGNNFKDLRFKTVQPTTDSGEDTEAGSLLCIPAYSSVLLLRDSLCNMGSDTDRAFDAMHHARSIHPFTEKVIRSFDYLNVLIHEPERLKAMTGGDGFTVDLLEFFHTLLLPLHFVVLFQAYMEIYDTMEGMLWQPGIQLIGTAARIKPSIARFEEYMLEMSDCEVYKPDNDGNVRSRLLGYIKQAIETPLIDQPDFIDNYLPPVQGLPSSASFLSNLWVHLPVLCGYFTQKLADLKHGDGVQSCNDGRVMMAAAHLYRACRKAGLLKGDWEDMEFFIRTQGAKTLGLRDTPARSPVLLSAAKHYGLAFGVELKEYANRPRSLPIPEQRVRLPSYDAIRHRRTGFVAPASPWRTSMAESIKSLPLLNEQRHELNTSVLYTLARNMLADPTLDIEASIREQWQACRRLTPVQLLSLLKHSMVAYEPSLSYDYHCFFVDCARMIDSTIANCRERVGRLRESRGLSPACLAYELVDEILWEAATWEDGLATAVRRNGMLREVSTYMEEIVNNNSSAWTDHAQKGRVHTTSVLDVSHIEKLSKDICEEKRVVRLAGQVDGMSVSVQGSKLAMSKTDLNQDEEEYKRKTEARRAKNRRRKKKGKSIEQQLGELSIVEGTGEEQGSAPQSATQGK